MFQQILFPPDSTWQAPNLADLPNLKGVKRIGFDVETRDPQLQKLGVGSQRDGYIVGYCLAIEDGPAFYLPIRHATGQNMSVDGVNAYIRDQVKEFDGEVVGANLRYDLDYLCQELGGFLGRDIFPKAKAFRDVQLADPLINENFFKYSLDSIAERWGVPLKQEADLNEAARDYGFVKKGKRDANGKRPVDAKSNLWKLDPKYIGEYGEHDARLPLTILRLQEQAIEEAGMQRIWNLESAVLPALVRMKRRGVRIDFDRLDFIEQWCITQEGVAFEEVRRFCGTRLSADDLSLPNALAPVLQGIGAQLSRNPKNNQWKIDEAVLKGLKHPVATAILTARKINKIRRDFVRSIRDHACNGRIHCSFNQLKRASDDGHGGTMGAVTGRLSSSNPNLQQQPGPKDTDPETMGITDHLALMWRSIYLPEEGAIWACNDYSQQEPRLLHHYAELSECTGAKAACDRYRTDPNTDNHSMFAEMCEIKRKIAKTIYLGKCYRMGGAKFATSLGLPTMRKLIGMGSNQRWIVTAGEEAQALLDKFDAGAPYVNELATKVEKEARRKGYVRTLLGRHCHFELEKDGSGNLVGVHKAINKLIQGSAADQTKQALVACDQELLWDDSNRMILQVHDELDFSVVSRSEAESYAEIMRDVVPLTVPCKVDVETGPNWADIQ